MAERRTIWHKISLSEQVDAVTPWSQLLYTWSIAHADDIGVLPRKSKVLKGKVFPLKDNLTAEQVEVLIQELLRQNLYLEVEIENEMYLYIKNFGKHQSLRKDRAPQLCFHYPLKEVKGTKAQCRAIIRENWDKLEALTVTWQSRDGQMTSEVKGSEVKRSEEKRSEKNTGATSAPKQRPPSKASLAEKDPEVEKGIAEVIKFFETYKVNAAAPQWYGNTTQRAAARILFTKFGLAKVEEMVRHLPLINQMPLYEVKHASTPHQLLEHWYLIEQNLTGATLRKQEQKAKPKIV